MQLFCIMQYTFYVNILWKMWEWLPTTMYIHIHMLLGTWGTTFNHIELYIILAFLTKYTVET